MALILIFYRYIWTFAWRTRLSMSYSRICIFHMKWALAVGMDILVVYWYYQQHWKYIDVISIVRIILDNAIFVVSHLTNRCLMSTFYIQQYVLSDFCFQTLIFLPMEWKNWMNNHFQFKKLLIVESHGKMHGWNDWRMGSNVGWVQQRRTPWYWKNEHEYQPNNQMHTDKLRQIGKRFDDSLNRTFFLYEFDWILYSKSNFYKINTAIIVYKTKRKIVTNEEHTNRIF